MQRYLRQPQYQLKVSKAAKRRLENVRAYYLTGALKFEELASRLSRSERITDEQARDFLMGWLELTT